MKLTLIHLFSVLIILSCLIFNRYHVSLTSNGLVACPQASTFEATDLNLEAHVLPQTESAIEYCGGY